MRTFIFISVVIAILSLTSADEPAEDGKSNMAQHWLRTVSPYSSQLSEDTAQQVKGAVKFLEMLGGHSRFAAISKMFLENKNEEQELVMKTLQYVLMKSGMNEGVSKFIEKKIEPVQKEQETSVETLKSILKYKDDKHKIQKLIEFITEHYLQKQQEKQRYLMSNIKGFKEMLDKFKTMREYLAANNFSK